MNLITLTILAIFLCACSQFETKPVEEPVPPPYVPPYSRADIDELLAFGSEMSLKSEAGRDETCKTLLKEPNQPLNPGIVLHLMLGRMLSNSCGEISTLLPQIASIPKDAINDEQVQKLIGIAVESLKRMKTSTKKISVLEHKLQSKKSKPSKKDDTMLLREKLDAIRSMEKQLDESGEAK